MVLKLKSNTNPYFYTLKVYNLFESIDPLKYNSEKSLIDFEHIFIFINLH